MVLMETAGAATVWFCIETTQDLLAIWCDGFEAHQVLSGFRSHLEARQDPSSPGPPASPLGRVLSCSVHLSAASSVHSKRAFPPGHTWEVPARSYLAGLSPLVTIRGLLPRSQLRFSPLNYSSLRGTENRSTWFLTIHYIDPRIMFWVDSDQFAIAKEHLRK